MNKELDWLKDEDEHESENKSRNEAKHDGRD
jgi:hypothetical protein